MRFYQQPPDQPPHRFYCGVDLHARCMYLCILDAGGQTVLHRDYPAEPGAFLDAIAGKEATLVAPREAAYRSAVMEAVYEGAKHNNWETPKT